MKERPILMSAPMVRAILAGRKTQTRRLVKPQPSESFLPYVGHYQRTLVDRKEGEQFPDPVVRFGAFDEKEDYPCPYGKPCDRLWVQEEHRVIKGGFHVNVVEYPADGAQAERIIDNREMKLFRARKFPFAQTRARFMYRSFSRITLEIVSVRVERLNGISHEDAVSEGVEGGRGPGYDFARTAYKTLWESINGPGSWDANPWVWVVEFKRVTP